MEGKVQRFQVLKGYGFLLQDFRTRLFFHVNDWKSDIQPRVGMVVTFDLAAPNKPGQLNRAVNILPIGAGCVESVGGGAK